MIKIKLMKCDDEQCASLCEYAQNSSWSAGPSLAKRVRAGYYDGWERVVAAIDEDTGNFVGYSVFSKDDCIPNLPYTPYIGYVFVDEAFRGQRISEKMIGRIMEYAKEIGFEQVYLTSDHVGLYEKYGFAPIYSCPAPWDENEIERIFVKKT